MFHVDDVRLCLWSAATNGPIAYPRDNTWWRATVEWYWQVKTKRIGEKPVEVPLCLSQILGLYGMPGHEPGRQQLQADGFTSLHLTSQSMSSVNYSRYFCLSVCVSPLITLPNCLSLLQDCSIRKVDGLVLSKTYCLLRIFLTGWFTFHIRTVVCDFFMANNDKKNC